MITEETLYSWVKGDKTGTKELKDTLDLFRRTNAIRPGQALDTKLAFSFLTWVNSIAIGGPLKNALDYGTKLHDRQENRKLLENERDQLKGG